MAEAQEAVVQHKPQRSWFGRNWWWVLLVVLIGGGVVCCGVCGGIMVLVFGKLKESEVYRMTFDAVKADAVVIDRLGEPITDTWFVSGSVNIRNGEGDAKLLFPIKGPKDAAQVTSEARRSGGKWTLTYVEVAFPDGQKHTLPLSTDNKNGGLEEAPRFVPPGEVPQNPESP